MRVPGNEMFHARINSRSGGGAAGPRTCAQRQQPRVEVQVRLHVRLPGCRGAGRAALQVPSVRSYAYDMLHIFKPHQGVGTGMQAAEPISEADRFSKLHCKCCCKAKQAPPHSKRCKSGFTPPKARKLQARRRKQFEVRWGGAFAH